MVQQGAAQPGVPGAGSPNPIAMMQAQMPALLPEWEAVLNALGLTEVA
jgi:hypothetical protein